MGASKHEEQKEAFAVMRANGLLLRECAEKLGIGLRTAERWNKLPEVSERVRAYKQEQLAELREVCEMPHKERIKALSQTVARIDEALKVKDFEKMQPEELLALKLRYLKALKEEENEW